ncbi:hypothetical protein D3C78_1520960 [compost metagenome]
MQEAEGGLLRRAESAPVTPHRLEQMERPDDIGLDEVLRSVDRAVDVRFRREVDHGPRPVLSQQTIHQRPVADIAMHEGMARVPFQAGEILQVAGVGQLVEADHRFVMAGEPVQHEVGADEAGAAGYEDGHGCVACVAWRRSAN